MGAGAPALVAGQPNVWEKSRRPRQVEAVADEAMDVTVVDGYIYVTVQRPVSVKLFSILGQLISNQTLPAGTSRLQVVARGIYILKTDTETRRIKV